jgi:hypothetical protein
MRGALPWDRRDTGHACEGSAQVPATSPWFLLNRPTEGTPREAEPDACSPLCAGTPDPDGASVVQELLDKFGEMSTFMNYTYRSFN